MHNTNKISLIDSPDKIQFVSDLGVETVYKQDVSFVGVTDGRVVLFVISRGGTRPQIKLDPANIYGFELLTLSEARSIIDGMIHRSNNGSSSVAIEPFKISGVHSNTLLPGIIGAGIQLTTMQIKNTSEFDVVIACGTSSGGSDLMAPQSISANSIMTVTINNQYSSELNQDVFVSSDSWGGATVDLLFNFTQGL